MYLPITVDVLPEPKLYDVSALMGQKRREPGFIFIEKDIYDLKGLNPTGRTSPERMDFLPLQQGKPKRNEYKNIATCNTFT